MLGGDMTAKGTLCITVTATHNCRRGDELILMFLLIVVHRAAETALLPNANVAVEQEIVKTPFFSTLQSREKVLVRGCEKFLPALA